VLTRPSSRGLRVRRGPSSIDAAIYGFVANILFYPIATPLKEFVDAHPADAPLPRDPCGGQPLTEPP
jgi:hypothetical protein